jgi:hypothetical protein
MVRTEGRRNRVVQADSANKIRVSDRPKGKNGGATQWNGADYTAKAHGYVNEVEIGRMMCGRDCGCGSDDPKKMNALGFSTN